MHKYCKSSSKESCEVESVNCSTSSSINTNKVVTNKEVINGNVVNARNRQKCMRSQSVQSNAFPLSIKSYKERRRVSATGSTTYTSHLTRSNLMEYKSHLNRIYCAATLVSTKFAKFENVYDSNDNTTKLWHCNNVTNATPISHLQSNMPCNDAHSDIRATHASSSSSFKSISASPSPSPSPTSPIQTSTQNTIHEFNTCKSERVITRSKELKSKNVEIELQSSMSCSNPLEELQSQPKLRTTSLNIPRHRLTHKETNNSNSTSDVQSADAEQEIELLLLQTSLSTSSPTCSSSAIRAFPSQSDEPCVNTEQEYTKHNVGNDSNNQHKKIQKIRSDMCASEMLWLADKTGAIEIHDLHNEQEETLLRTIYSNEGKSAVTVMHSLSNNQVAVGFANGKLHIYNTETATRVARLLAHTTSITCLSSTELNLHSPTQQLHVTRREPEKEESLYVCCKEQYVPILLSAASDGVIAKWELQTHTCVSRFRSDVHAITALAITQSKMFALAGNERGVIQMWDLMNDSLIELSKSEKRNLMKCCTSTANDKNELQKEEKMNKVELFDYSNNKWVMNENESTYNSLNLLQNDASYNARTESLNYINNIDKSNNVEVAKGTVNKRGKKSKRGKNAKRLLHTSKKRDVNNTESMSAMLTPSQKIWSYTHDVPTTANGKSDNCDNVVEYYNDIHCVSNVSGGAERYALNRPLFEESCEEIGNEEMEHYLYETETIDRRKAGRKIKDERQCIRANSPPVRLPDSNEWINSNLHGIVSSTNNNSNTTGKVKKKKKTKSAVKKDSIAESSSIKNYLFHLDNEVKEAVSTKATKPHRPGLIKSLLTPHMSSTNTHRKLSSSPQQQFMKLTKNVKKTGLENDNVEDTKCVVAKDVNLRNGNKASMSTTRKRTLSNPASVRKTCTVNKVERALSTPSPYLCNNKSSVVNATVSDEIALENNNTIIKTQQSKVIDCILNKLQKVYFTFHAYQQEKVLARCLIQVHPTAFNKYFEQYQRNDVNITNENNDVYADNNNIVSIDVTKERWLDMCAEFAWPIRHPRTRPITGLAIVADSLLISVSKESTACIISLPSGKLIRKIDVNSDGTSGKNTSVQYTKHAAAYTGKRKAWSWVCANSVVPGQVYLGSVDGSICVLDLLQPHMPIIANIHSANSNLSTVYISLPLTCTPQLFCVLHKNKPAITSYDSKKEQNNEISAKKIISIVPMEMQYNDDDADNNGEVENKHKMLLRRHASLLQSLSRLCCSNAALKANELRQLHHEGKMMKISYSLFSTYVHFAKWQHWLYVQRYHNYENKVLHQTETSCTAQQIRCKYWCRWMQILGKHRFWRGEQVHWSLQEHLLHKTSSSSLLFHGHDKLYLNEEYKKMIISPLEDDDNNIPYEMVDRIIYVSGENNDNCVMHKTQRKVMISQLLIRMAEMMQCERHRLIAKQYFTQWQRYTKQQNRMITQMISYNKLLLSLSGNMYSTSHFMLHALSANALHSFRKHQAHTLSSKALELILCKSQSESSSSSSSSSLTPAWNTGMHIWNTWQRALRWKYYRQWYNYVHHVRYATHASKANTQTNINYNNNNYVKEYSICNVHQESNNKNELWKHNKPLLQELSESLVEPLSSLFIRTHEVRLRYFYQWRKYALYTAKVERLHDEEEILQAEREAMQSVIDSGISKDVLAFREVETSEAMEQARRLHASLLNREVQLNSQIERLRQDTVLGKLLNAFSLENHYQCKRANNSNYNNNKSEQGSIKEGKEHNSTCNSELNSFNALTLHNECDTSQLSSEQPEPSDEAEEYHYSTTTMTVNSSVMNSNKYNKNGNGCLFEYKTNATNNTMLGEESENVLLNKVGSLLRALKGKALQCDRDGKEIASAQAWALKLPIVDLPTSIINNITRHRAPSSSLSFAHTNSSPSEECNSQTEMKNNSIENTTSSLYSPLSHEASHTKHGFATVLSVTNSSNQMQRKQQDGKEHEEQEEEEVLREQYKSTSKMEERHNTSIATTSSNSALFGAVRPSVRHRARVTSHVSSVATSPVGVSTKQRAKLGGVSEVNKPEATEITTNPLSSVNINSSNSTTTRITPRAVNWNTSTSAEPIYASLAIAFDALVVKLYDRLTSMVHEIGVNVHNKQGNTETLMRTEKKENNECNNPELWLSTMEHFEELKCKMSILESSSTETSSPELQIHSDNTEKMKPVNQVQEPLKWVERISMKDKKEIMALLVKLITLFDCFIAHSEMPLESTSSSLSLRGISSIQPLPLHYLCSRSSAQTLLSLACVLLELCHQRVWEEQNTICAIQSIIHSANANVLESMLPHSTQFASTTYKTHKPATHRELNKVRQKKNNGLVQLLNPCTETGSNLSVSRITQQTWEASSVDSNGKSKNCNSSALQSAASFTMNVIESTISNNISNEEQEQEQYQQSSLLLQIKESMPHIPKLNISSLTNEWHNSEETKMVLKETKWDEYQDRSVGSAHTHDGDVNNISGSYSYASLEDRSVSTSHHLHSLSSTTPRSIGRTPRTFRVSAKAGPIIRPYLGFRANINRETPFSTNITTTTTVPIIGTHESNHDVNVSKENSDCVNVPLHEVRSVRPTMIVTEVASSYINANGEQTMAPAAAAGLQAGDELVRFAGYAVTDLPAFNAIVSRHVRPNAALAVVLRRNGEEIRTTIHVGTRKT